MQLFSYSKTKMSGPEHKQVSVKDNRGYTVEVDEGMVDILKLFWDRDFDTVMSCEDNNGTIWINFWLSAFKEFARAAIYCQDDSLYNFLIYKCDTTILFDDENDEERVEFSVSVRFDKELRDEFMQCWARSFDSKRLKK